MSLNYNQSTTTFLNVNGRNKKTQINPRLVFLILIYMNNGVLVVGQIYAKTEDDLHIYENCIRQLKKLECKIMIADSSVCQTKFDYINLCDYYLYDKENRLFENHKYENYYINHYVMSDNVKLNYPCINHPTHELNILYTIAKTFNLAKTIGYKYILRLECDAIITDEHISLITNKIMECVSLNKKAVLSTLDNSVSTEYVSTNILFCDINWFLSKVGNVRTENEWLDFVKNNNLSDDLLEITLGKILKTNVDDYITFDNQLKITYLKGLRYKETRRFIDSYLYIDFFKNSDGQVFFAVNNSNYDKFPDKLAIYQYTPTRSLGNEIKNPLKSTAWVLVENDIINVEIEIDNQIITLSREDVFSTKNIIEFY
jgi:hypothetical protein